MIDLRLRFFMFNGVLPWCVCVQLLLENLLPAAWIDRGDYVNPDPLLGFAPPACVRVAHLWISFSLKVRVSDKCTLNLELLSVHEHV